MPMSARFLLLAAFLFGCGGKAIADDTVATDSGAATNDGGSSSDALIILPDGNVVVPTDAGATDYCSAASERATRCMSEGFSLSRCHEQLACFKQAVRPDALSTLLTCFATRPCGTSDDRCVAQSAEKFITDPAVQSWVKDCNDKRRACEGSFSDDYCGYEYGLFTDALRTKMQTCLSRSCAEVRTCFDTVFAAAGCDG